MKKWIYCRVLVSLLKNWERYGLTSKQKSQVEALIMKIIKE